MSFIEACVNDTDSIDLGFNASNELEATLRLGVENTIETVASGSQVRFGSTSGLGTDANGLIADVQSPGLAIDANGIAKVTSASLAGWFPGASDDTFTHNLGIARGSTTPFAVASLAVSVAQSVSTRIVFVCYISVRIRTPWLGLGDPAAHVSDEVGVQLQTNYNNAGWVTMDRFELVGNNQRTTANLKGIRTISASGGTTHTMQCRGVVTGGIISPTAIQGTLERSFYRGQTAWW